MYCLLIVISGGTKIINIKAKEKHKIYYIIEQQINLLFIIIIKQKDSVAQFCVT